MFEIDLTSGSDGVWFDYQESHFDKDSGEWVFEDSETDASVCVRDSEKFWIERIDKRKRNERFVLNETTRKMERVSWLSEQTAKERQAELDDAYDYAIVGLRNFKNKSTGLELECDRETKLALMKNAQFDRFIGRCLKLLRGAELDQKETEKKT